MEQEIKWKGKYKSELMMVCHMDAQAMYAVGAISDKEMWEFDQECLVSSAKTLSDDTDTKEQKTMPAYAR